HPVPFPAWETLPGSGVLADGQLDETAGQRLRVLKQLESAAPPRLLLTNFAALLQPVPDRAQLLAQRRQLRVGESLDLEGFLDWLVDHGYRGVEAVELPGEFSRRGGILDVFSPDGDNPWRAEFFGDEIESLRQFDALTQRSLGQIAQADVTGVQSPDSSISLSGHLCDYLPEGSWTVLVELEELEEQGKHYLDRVPDVAGLFSSARTLEQLIRLP